VTTGNTVNYQRYLAGAVPPDPTLGVHFATINYDTTALISWLNPLLTQGPLSRAVRPVGTGSPGPPDLWRNAG
jgi:hypothetical protein